MTPLEMSAACRQRTREWLKENPPATEQVKRLMARVAALESENAMLRSELSE